MFKKGKISIKNYKVKRYDIIPKFCHFNPPLLHKFPLKAIILKSFTTSSSSPEKIKIDSERIKIKVAKNFKFFILKTSKNFSPI